MFDFWPAPSDKNSPLFFPGNPKKSTVAQAEKWFLSLCEKIAVICPVCHKRSGSKRRRLSAHLVAGLIVLYGYQRDNHVTWVHFERILRRVTLKKPPICARGELAALRHWNLVTVGKGEFRGCYRLTEHGKRVVLGKAKLHAFQVRFEGSTLRLEGKKYKIQQLLGTYSYDKLMKHNYGDTSCK